MDLEEDLTLVVTEVELRCEEKKNTRETTRKQVNTTIQFLVIFWWICMIYMIMIRCVCSFEHCCQFGNIALAQMEQHDVCDMFFWGGGSICWIQKEIGLGLYSRA